MNPTLNARGGINKVSNREREGLVQSGSTGTINSLKTPMPFPVSPTSAGLTIPQQTNETIAQYQRFGLVPSFSIPTNESVPSTALTSNVSMNDVLRKRADMEQQQNLFTSLQTGLQDLSTAVGQFQSKGGNFLSNPDKFLSMHYGADSTTPAEGEYDAITGNMVSRAKDFFSNITGAREQANKDSGVYDSKKALDNINKEIAEREVKLRNDLKALTEAPENRGVARSFALDNREAIKSQAAFDLANLAIVQQALQGNYDTARQISSDLIDDQYNAYEAEMKMYQMQLDALAPKMNREQKKQAEMVQIALDERARLLENAKESAQLMNDYLLAALKGGAPESVWRSIQQATSPEEAFMLAAPYLRSSSGGGSYDYGYYGGESGYNTPLANMDLYASKTSAKEIQDAVQRQFSPELSSLLLKTLSDEQLRNFLTELDNEMVRSQMNIDPMEYFRQYAKRNGIKLPGESSSSGDALDFDSL